MLDSASIDHLDETTLNMLESLLATDFSNLIEVFLSDADQRYQDLLAACQSGSQTDIRHLAHSLKGSSLNIGALNLSALCRRMEADALANKALQNKALLADIGEEIAWVKAELTQRYL